jgi:hypothetical protein
MARKYYSQWVNAEGDTCRLDFHFASYSGAATELSSGMRAFVLKEFNSDNDFYKPIRPQQAEFEILADGITLESFLFNNDNEVSIQFLWNGSVYWRGWLIQDDFEESWVDSKHFITLRATEQLSGLNIIAPTLPVGHSTPFDFIINALANTSIANGLFCDTNIINNLFYETMTDKDVDNAATCLNQMFISNATFQRTLTTFDDYQTILEKINTSFNQTIFQYNGDAYLVRMSEFLTYPANLPGVEYQPFNVFFPFVATNESYLAYIGINEDIKPIMPEMLRQVVRPYKKFQIDYKYEFPPEIVPNSSFKRGAYETTILDSKIYAVDNWQRAYGSRETPTIASPSIKREEFYDIDGNLLDNRVQIVYVSGQANTFGLSEEIYIEKNEKLKIKVSFAESEFTAATKKVMQVLFIARTATVPYGYQRWGMDEGGNWVVSPTYNWDDAAIPFISVLLPRVNPDLSNEYVTFEITSQPIYTAGKIVIIFYNDDPASNLTRYHKDFTLEIIPRYNGLYNNKIIGDYDRYTKTDDIKQNLQLQSYLDDSDTNYTRGSIFSPDNILTGDKWYRMQYQSESFTFKREKAIAHWLLNRRYRQLITGNFYGLTWGGGEIPIGLMNRFIFTDDAPTKQFMIVNLQEIDFVSCQWKATLMETYDSTIDTSFTDYPPHSFDFLYSE